MALPKNKFIGMSRELYFGSNSIIFPFQHVGEQGKRNRKSSATKLKFVDIVQMKKML
jgi:hypothetical protein